MAEIYVSTDIEADGPIPGPHSMLSFASAAFWPDSTLIGTFSANLQTLEGASGHPVTMAWWETQPVAWEASRQDQQPPASAMLTYLEWLKALPGRPVFVAYPAGFDFMFVSWYLYRFTGENPYGFSALDMKSFAMAVLKLNFCDAVKRNMPGRWFPNLPHTHIALDDALEQGYLFCNMLQESKQPASGTH